jgi:hypothetical protein
MKKSYIKFIALGSVVIFTLTFSCKRLLNQEPVGSLGATVLANKAGVDGLLIGAYHMLSGFSVTNNDGATIWSAGPDNWSYGGVGSDDAYTGSSLTDQPPFIQIENHTMDASNVYLNEKWVAEYNGIQRANDVIREVPLVKDGSVSAAYGAEAVGEARFLRGVFHMEVAKIFRNVPYVDENVTYGAGNYNVGNPGPIWDKIEADFAAAMGTTKGSVLPLTQPQIGRANYYAAEAMLAQAYMFDHKYALALPLLTDLLTNGETAGGTKYAFEPYSNNFNAAYNNGPESVFAVQMTVNDGSNGSNGNPGMTLDYPVGGFSGCCGFYQPSISLANAFQVDANGLPMFQPSVANPGVGSFLYNDNQLPSDHGYQLDPSNVYRLDIAGTFSGTAFVPPNTAVDPRLDWTLGRYGIPFLDWGLCGGEQWSRGDVCPYDPKKNIFWQSVHSGVKDNVLGWAGPLDNANNYNMVRLSEIYLWAAECEVEVGSLANAQADVNAVRTRAADPTGWVHTYVDNSNPSAGFTNTPAANYKVGLYGVAPGTSFAAMGQSLAREAVHIEEQLETGMEGKRFFDIQRWDPIYGGPEPSGYMAGVENFHIKATLIGRFSTTGKPADAAPDLNGHTFTAGKNEVYPIPLGQINVEAGKLKQNTGYN